MKKALPIERAFRLNPPTLRLAEFWFDGGKHVRGWSTGEDWNGWGVPLFDESQIDAAMRALRATGDLGCDFHSGDILEIWPKEDRDQISEHEAIRFKGKIYWQLDGLTWNQETLRTAAVGWNGLEWVVYGVGDDEDEAAADARNWTEPPWLTFVPISEAQIEAMGDHGEEIRCAMIGLDVGDAKRTTPAHLRTSERGRSVRERNRPLDIPGWSVGYNDEISAHAAVRTPRGMKGTWLFVMTSPEDREPRSLDEEAAVGLYYLNEDGDWEQVGFQDFPDVKAVLKLNDEEILLLIEHGLSMDQARELLIEEFDDWEESDGEASIMPWMQTILKDAGVGRPEREFVESAAHEATEQIRNASSRQILDYMNERAEAINE